MLGEEGRKGRLEKGGGGSPAHVKAEIKKKIQTPQFSPSHPSPRPTPQVQAAKGQVQVSF